MHCIECRETSCSGEASNEDLTSRQASLAYPLLHGGRLRANSLRTDNPVSSDTWVSGTAVS
jgi:hypothetical protein